MLCGQGLRAGLVAPLVACALGCAPSLDLSAVTRVDVFAGERWFIALGRPGRADAPASAVVIASDGARLSPGEVVEGALFVSSGEDALRACTARDAQALVGAKLAPETAAATLTLPCVPLAAPATTATAALPLALLVTREDAS